MSVTSVDPGPDTVQPTVPADYDPYEELDVPFDNDLDIPFMDDSLPMRFSGLS